MSEVRALAIVAKGTEKIASAELAEKFYAKHLIEKEQCVQFSAEPADLGLACYSGQSVSRILQLLFDFEFSDWTDLSNRLISCLSLMNLADLADTTVPVGVECIRKGKHEFHSPDVEKLIRQELAKRGYSLDLKKPEILLTAFVCGTTLYLGIDYGGFDLDKREYRIFNHPADIKGPLAYALVRLSGYTKKKVLVDPFCISGTVIIEAALFASGFPVNYFRKDLFMFPKLKPFKGKEQKNFFAGIDKRIDYTKQKLFGYSQSLKDILASRKNAKIAGIDKCIEFSKVDAEWLDIKFKPKTVDYFVTVLPSLKFDQKRTERLYKEFFYQAEYILKDSGTIAVISRNPELIRTYAAQYFFALAETQSIWSGEQEHRVFILKKEQLVGKGKKTQTH